MIHKYPIEEIILRHPGRGMDILSRYLPDNFCEEAMKKLLELPKGNVLLTTGFYVAGYAETDGPMGTYFLAKQLDRMGFHSTIVTDELCKDYFEDVNTEYVPFNADEEVFADLLEKYTPVCCISIERCGRNSEGDYANMRGISIKENTAPIDKMFELAAKRGIYTMGVGDGGNEIGMGNLEKEISEKLSLVPCVTKVDNLIIATVSNWGAFGMMAYLDLLAGTKYFPPYEDFKRYLDKTVELGSVDGLSKENVGTVDGFSQDIEKEIVDGLYAVVHCA